jgi:dephospho-CoA kinase
VLVVEAHQAVRIERLVARGLPETDARARIGAQASDEQRRAVADVVLDNSGTPEALAAQVDRFWSDRVLPAVR